MNPWDGTVPKQGSVPNNFVPLIYDPEYAYLVDVQAVQVLPGGNCNPLLKGCLSFADVWTQAKDTPMILNNCARPIRFLADCYEDGLVAYTLLPWDNSTAIFHGVPNNGVEVCYDLFGVAAVIHSPR